jgi:hypothetical protein
MATSSRVARCKHFTASATGTREARQLRDGRWEYRTPYKCPECGSLFVETHESPVAVR